MQQAPWALAALGILILTGCGPSAADVSLPEVVDYNWHVKPILSDRCYQCHGPDERARQADLRLDTREGAYGYSRDDSTLQIITPYNAAASVLVDHISSEDPNWVMPPPDSKLTLTRHEIALIRAWIDQGAEWKPHWAFTAPAQPSLPEVRRADQVRNPIDHFVLARLESENLSFSSEAAKARLLRRVSFDLTGLPPTPAAIDAFVADSDPQAYERIVDRLLASPAYGERMASMWLDIARYADTHGYQDDRPRTMWPWRDWVVRAYNNNLPYDEFITWQLAGDLLPEATYDQKLATGFNRNHAITQEGGVVPSEYITEYVADRTNTTATAFLGLTMECARCHDHKYDPVLQRDYYSMFAFFNGIDEKAPISYFDLSPVPSMRMEDPAYEESLENTIRTLDSLETVADQWSVPEPPADWQPDLTAALQQGLFVHLPLDSLTNLRTPARTGLPAFANTGLETDLPSPVLEPGFMGQSMAFDGVNFINLGEEADFEWYSRFTLSGWVWARTQDKDAALLSKRIGEQHRRGYDLTRTQDGYLRLRLVQDNEHRIVVTSTVRIPPESWTHVAATYDGSSRADGVTLYINGQKVPVRAEMDELSRMSILNGNGLLAGNFTPRKKTRGDLTGLAGGRLDELRIYTRALTDLEVAHLAGAAHPPARQFYREHQDDRYRTLTAQLDSVRQQVRTIPFVMIMEEMETPRPTFVLDRGAYDAPVDSVGPDTPAAILSFPDDLPRNRLGLARWLTHESNPLTARVAANRYWQILFGVGLVHTPEDFGNQGALPSHPALLDYLAIRYIELDWNTKALLKEIVTSATYRQSSAVSEELQLRDPGNMLLARGPRKRLSAEMVRDNALAASGLLDRTMYGEPVRPYQPAGLWKALANQVGENRYRPGPNVYRRSVYTYWKRTIPPPAMLTFDAPDRTVCTVEREPTATPLQSLVLMNDPQYVEAARVMAFRLSEVHNDDDARIRAGFRLLTSRDAERAELKILQDLLEEQQRHFGEFPERAAQLLTAGKSATPQDRNPTDLAALTMVISTVMNLDEAQHR
ncbi:MAG: DUF1553 domain-containing protein [Bacteroidota bacterium]|nr:DUF1553 domain-containing protein [Bacteroidota bacterium]